MEKSRTVLAVLAVVGGVYLSGCGDPGIPNVSKRQVFNGTPEQNIEHIKQNGSLSDAQKVKFIAEIKKKNHLQ